MKKLLHIPEYFADTLEPCVQVLDPYKSHGLEKTASEAWDYIQHVKPKEGKRYILVIAMGAGEFWGANKNGDYFIEADLIRCYKNFETTYDHEGKINGGALIFKHHKNKLAENHPWFGTVAKAFYNHKMHRVELLLEVWGSRGQDIIDRIDKGETIAVSMGVRIPYDTCSICGNKAKKKEEYCDHLKREAHKPCLINTILRDGRQIYAINGNYNLAEHPNPLRFFDISIVFRPADQTGYMLKKVAFAFDDGDGEEVIGSAELYDTEASYGEKVAYLRKLSEIDKIVKGLPIAASQDGEFRAIKAYKPTLDKMVKKMPSIDDQKIEDLSRYPMNKILSTLSHHGILLTTPEFVCLAFRKLTGRKLEPSEVRKLADLQGEIFEELAEKTAEELEEMEHYEMFEEVSPDPDIFNIVRDIHDGRDLTNRGIIKKAADPSFGVSPDLHDSQFPWGDGKAMLGSEYLSDPHTGKRYAVSQTAIDDATVWENTTRVLKALIATGLAGGLYAYLKSKNSKMSPLAGMAALALGAHQLRGALIKDESEGYRKSESGASIPRSAMMMEKKSAFKAIREAVKKQEREGNQRLLATAAPIAATSLLKKYYDGRLRSGEAGSYGTPLEEHLDTAGKWAYHHPLVTGGAGVVGAHWALNAAKKLKLGI
jgi:hypothetical protein